MAVGVKNYVNEKTTNRIVQLVFYIIIGLANGFLVLDQFLNILTEYVIFKILIFLVILLNVSCSVVVASLDLSK